MALQARRFVGRSRRVGPPGQSTTGLDQAPSEVQEVRVGNVETSDGSRQVFGAVAKAGTDIAVLVRRGLETVGRTAATTLTAFTDGCPGLRSMLAEAGVTKPPIADWFHIAMRLQHAKQAASGLPTNSQGRKEDSGAVTPRRALFRIRTVYRCSTAAWATGLSDLIEARAVLAAVKTASRLTVACGQS